VLRALQDHLHPRTFLCCHMVMRLWDDQMFTPSARSCFTTG
jgi:hypothetical protein